MNDYPDGHTPENRRGRATNRPRRAGRSRPWSDRVTPGGPEREFTRARDPEATPGDEAGTQPADTPFARDDSATSPRNDETPDARSEQPGAAAGEARGRQGHGEGEHRHEDQLGELVEELRMLAETMLERVEPVLRRAAADGGVEWDGCSWCPVCAAAALVRGEHHDVVATLAEHGTAIVTVLREALAGIPVEPVLPDPEPEGEAPQGDSPAERPPAARPGYVSIPVQIKV